jgi:hypothetical protein
MNNQEIFTAKLKEPVYVKQEPYVGENGIYIPAQPYALEGTGSYRMVISREMFVEAYNKYIKGE